jgi:hypothetical protein
LVRLCHAWAESRRQKHSKGERRADPRDSGNVNLGVFAGEFAHALAAGAARRDQGIAFPKYFGDAPLTGGDHWRLSQRLPRKCQWDAFSTFAPEKIAHETVRRAAPTANPE